MDTVHKGFEPRRFRSTVAFYARYRLVYPDRLLDRVLDLVGAGTGDTLLDLGCGPGTLAIPFAKRGLRVTAIDPEPEMLAAAAEGAGMAGVEIDLRQGSSFALPSPIGPFKLVSMGRSFHWMDRAATLRALEMLVPDGGALAFFDDERPRTAENVWQNVLRDIANKYGRRNEPHVRDQASNQYRRHESYLFDSAFSQLDGLSVIVKRPISADEIVGRAFSLSTSSPEKLSDRAAIFEAELREALATLSPNGRFTEIARLNALVARRP